MAKKLTQEEWIIDAQKTHQKRYDYSLVVNKTYICYGQSYIKRKQNQC